MQVSCLARFLVIAIIVAALLFIWKPGLFGRSVAAPKSSMRVLSVRNHSIGRAGVIPTQNVPRFEQYMVRIMRESGGDMRFILLPDTAGESIEMLAANLMDQLQIGGRTGHQYSLCIAALFHSTGWPLAHGPGGGSAQYP